MEAKGKMGKKKGRLIAGLMFDRLMSGGFMKLFTVVLGASVATFLIIAVLAYFIRNWSIGSTFIQLTNPTIEPSASEDPWSWTLIVLTNLFGLFVLNGVILTIFVNWVSNRKDRYLKGEAHYDGLFKKSYAVIIGGHKVVAGLAKSLINKPDIEYLLVLTQRDPEEIRKEIFSEIDDDSLADRIVIYSGDRTSWNELSELHLDKAREIYIIGETYKTDDTSHDAINMQCWDIINRHITTRLDPKIPCHVMFEYQSTFAAFQYTDLKLENREAFRFIPFSFYENWAQQVLLSDDTRHGYIPLDGIDGIQFDSPERAHLIVVGMSKMGMSLAIEAAHIAHYPNFNNPATGRPRTLITFIDKNARREMMFFMGRFRELFKLARWRYIKAPDNVIPPCDDTWKLYDTIKDIAGHSNREYPWRDPLKDPDCNSPYHGDYLGEDFIDIDFEFIEGDVSYPSIQKYIADACADNPLSKTTIAVCLPIAVESMSAALYFDASVYDNVQQIWVQQQESGALVNAVSEGLTGLETARFKAMRPFGMIDKCTYMARINSLLPKLVAYAYECLSRKESTTLAEEYAKSTDFDRFVNEVTDEWLRLSQDGGKSAISKRWSNLYCANSFPTKVRSFGIDLSNEGVLTDDAVINELAKVEHNRWGIEQLLLGVKPMGREYASMIPVEDKKLRGELKKNNIHPDLISNEKLGSVSGYDKEIAKIIPLATAIAKRAAEMDQLTK